MRSLLLSAAILSLGGAPALAQTADGSAGPDRIETTESARIDGLYRTSDLEGADLYQIDPESRVTWAEVGQIEGVSREWEDIGEIEDLVIDAEGNLLGVVAEIGGFLGLGENEILLPMAEVHVVQGGEDDEMVFVTRLGREILEEWPTLDDDYWE